MTPYGLQHQRPLNPALTTPPPVTYNPARQQNTTADGRPLAEQPGTLVTYSVTWNTANRDNKTDDNG